MKKMEGWPISFQVIDRVKIHRLYVSLIVEKVFPHLFNGKYSVAITANAKWDIIERNFPSFSVWATRNFLQAIKKQDKVFFSVCKCIFIIHGNFWWETSEGFKFCRVKNILYPLLLDGIVRIQEDVTKKKHPLMNGEGRDVISYVHNSQHDAWIHWECKSS